MPAVRVLLLRLLRAVAAAVAAHRASPAEGGDAGGVSGRRLLVQLPLVLPLLELASALLAALQFDARGD
eukprot:447155-Prymnesium_polylepis.1